jgi:hypothetical protein
MKIKWSPCAGKPEQVFTYVSEDTININGEDYTFQLDAIDFPNVGIDTNYVITKAYRETSILYLTVLRFYQNGSSPDWDTGVYQDFFPPPIKQLLIDTITSTDTIITEGTPV